MKRLSRRNLVIYCSLVLGYSSAHIRKKIKQGLLFDERVNLNLFELKQKECKKKGIIFVTFYDDLYPKRLKEVVDFPVILYCRGNVSLLAHNYMVAMVGARKPSDYGLSVAKDFSEKIAQTGVAIVSGMALGIDAACHRGALSVSGYTIAVLGSAIDQLYPRNNEKLGENIIKNKGLIISEYPIGSKINKFNFPMRNRIIAGLSESVIVVEASRRSGALITAFLALDYNRSLYAIPSDLGKTLGEGTNHLISQGAICLVSPDIVIEDLGLVCNAVGNPITTALESEVLRMLKLGLNFDKITRKLEIDPSELNLILLELEIKGLVKRLNNSFKIFD